MNNRVTVGDRKFEHLCLVYSPRVEVFKKTVTNCHLSPGHAEKEGTAA